MRMCPVCGHVNAGAAVQSCTHCWARLGEVAPVGSEEGAVLSRLFHRRIFRQRLVRWAFLLAAATGFTVWGVLVFFELGPLPPPPVSNINTDTGLNAWAEVRHDPQNTAFSPEQAPTPKTILWTYRTSSALSGAPAAAGGVVYLAANDGTIAALDGRTGEAVWEYRSDLPAGSGSTPAVTRDLVIVTMRVGVVIALDRYTGEPVWETDLRPYRAPLRGPPSVVNGTVYVGAANHTLYALDAANGILRWSFETRGWVIDPVAYADDTVLVASRDGLLHVLDTNTGRKRFVYDGGFSVYGGAAVEGDLAYLAAFPSAIYAIDRHAITYPFQRAFWAWQVQFWHWGFIDDFPEQKGSVWITDVRGDLTGAPAVAHGNVYFAVEQGRAAALNAATGETVWIGNVARDISTSLTVAGDTVLMGTDDGSVIGLDAHSGETLWDFPLGSPVTDSPISVGGVIYAVAEDGVLHALGTAE